MNTRAILVGESDDGGRRLVQYHVYAPEYGISELITLQPTVALDRWPTRGEGITGPQSVREYLEREATRIAAPILADRIRRMYQDELDSPIYGPGGFEIDD